MTARVLAAALCVLTLACVELGDRQPPSYRTVASAREATDEDRLTITVDLPVGEFRLTPAEGSTLYRANLVYDEVRFRPISEYDKASRHLRVGVDAHGVKGKLDLDPGSGQRLELTVSRSIPVSLAFKLGVADSEIELGDLSLERLELTNGAGRTTVAFSAPNRVSCSHVSLTVGAADLEVTGLGNARCERTTLKAGVGDVTLDFTGQWDPDQSAQVEVKLGVGDLTLRFPRGLGVAIEIERFLASVEAPRLVRDGNRLVSENFDSATNKVSLNIKTALGDIRVVWVDEGQ